MRRKIVIEPAMNGFIVKVGYQIVVFDNLRAMVNAIEAYYAQPEETEKAYREQYGLESIELQLVASPPPPKEVERTRDPK